MDARMAGAMLLSTTSIALNANADTIIYTVPNGRTAHLVYAILTVSGNANSTDISIGRAGAETDFIPTTQCDNLDASGDEIILMPIPSLTPPKQKTYAGNTVIEFKVTNQAGTSTGNILYLFGFLT